MSTEYDIISCRAGPGHCISSEENDHQFLLSGGICTVPLAWCWFSGAGKRDDRCPSYSPKGRVI
jgi:hypothetical protein